MANLRLKSKPKKKRVVKHRRGFTHQRIDKDQRIRIKEFILADKSDTLKDARVKARTLTEGNIRTRIKLEDGKYNIYTYFKLNPIRRKRLEHLEKEARNQKSVVAALEQEPKKEKPKPRKHKSSSSKLSKATKDKIFSGTPNPTKPKLNLTYNDLISLEMSQEAKIKLAEQKRLELKRFNEEGYYPPRLTKLMLKYYYFLADGYIPFYHGDNATKTARLGNKTRYIDPIPYFEEAIIWKSDIDQALSKLKSNGDINLPWADILKLADEDTVQNYLPFMDNEQRVIVGQFILGVEKYPNASDIFKKFVAVINGEAQNGNS